MSIRRPSQHQFAAFYAATSTSVQMHLGCRDVPLMVIELADGSHECVSPQSAREKARPIAFTLLRQAHHLLGREQFDELVDRARAEFQ